MQGGGGGGFLGSMPCGVGESRCVRKKLQLNEKRLGRDVSLSHATVSSHPNPSRRSFVGEQGWRNGESARLQPMWQGFSSQAQCHVG